MLTRSDLRPYQETMADFIKDNPKCACWVLMRGGKTISTLTAVSDLFDDFAIGKVLVVAPLRVALNSWPSEFEVWQHISHLSHTIIRGTPKQRQQKARERTHVHIINRENLAWLSEFWGEDWPYDMVVLDESRSFKNHKRRTPKGAMTRFGAIVSQLPRIDRLVELTGTPAPGGLLDLWAPTYLLDHGERLGKNITAYRDRFFQANTWGGFVNYELRAGTDEIIHDRLRDITYVLEAGDYVSLPEKIITPVTVPLDTKARKVYETAAREFLLEFEDDTVEITSAAGKLNKLLQISNGAVYRDTLTKEWEEVHKLKLEYMDELVESANGDSILVAYNYIPDKERILKRYKGAKFLDKNPQTIKDWNAGKIPMLVCHPASAGHGLNLYGGGSTIIWFGPTHDLELFQQLNERLSHPDKTEPINIFILTGEDTADQAALAALDGKNTTQKALLAAVKQQIEETVK